MPLRNMIALMGFKHVGKSTIGQMLAAQLQVPFIDLDQRIESSYTEQFQLPLTCRQIVQKHSLDFFNTLETAELATSLKTIPAVIALGGGTPLRQENQTLLSTCTRVQITAPRDQVLARIIQSGRPAFCRPEQTIREAFNQQWNTRNMIYNKFTTITIANDGSIVATTNKIIDELILNNLLR